MRPHNEKTCWADLAGRHIFMKAAALRPFLLALLCLTLGGCVAIASRDTGNRPAHHTATGFQNTGSFNPSPGAGWRHLISDPYSRDYHVPADRVLSLSQTLSGIKRAGDKDISITWIGHSTFLIRIGETWLLTDPFFAERSSPVAGVGPKRSVPAALTVDQLPPIDAVLISHNHYDHMDGAALRALTQKHPKVQIVVPLKTGSAVRSAGGRHVTELDWWQSHQLGGLDMQLVPAVHSSRRGLMGKNSALWGGFIISDGKRKLYFSGDTGFGSFIDDIRARTGPVDVAFIPIGAYKPQSLESGFHTTPEDGARLADIMGARHVIPTHYGTIALTPESYEDQVSRFRSSIGKDRRQMLKVGGTFAF